MSVDLLSFGTLADGTLVTAYRNKTSGLANACLRK